MNKNEFKAELVKCGQTYVSLAKAIGISENALWRKVNGWNEFTLPEIKKIACELCLDDGRMKAIFFN